MRRVQVRGDFADRHAVTDRERIEADEGRVRGIRHVAFHARAAERIRPVEHDDFDPCRRRRSHHERRRPDERVVARADILEVDDHRVDLAQHRGRRRASLTIEAVDRQAGEGIALEADVRVVLGRAPEPMLGGPQRRPTKRAPVVARRSHWGLLCSAQLPNVRVNTCGPPGSTP